MDDKENKDIKEEDSQLGKESVDYYNNVIRKEFAKEYLEEKM